MTASQAWKLVTLADVGTVVTGNTPPTKELQYYGYDIPFVKPTELVDRPIHAAPQMLSHVGGEVARKVPAGAVLVSCIGNLGKIGIARVPVALNQQINAIVFNNEVSPEFGFYYAQTLKGWLQRQSSATTIPIVNKGKFQQAPFPLAPMEDQRRIVAEIEKQFSRLDEAVAGLQRVKANLKRYKAVVLKSAVTGRLVDTEADLARREGRDYETGAQLLHRILDTRRKQWQGKGKYKEPAVPDTTDLPELPEGWVWATAEQLGNVQLGRQRSPKNRSKDFPVLYLRAANITESGLDLSDVLDMEFSPAEQERYQLRSGDVVLSEASGSPDQVGKPAIWQDQLPLCCFQNTVLRLRPAIVEMAPYVLTTFQSYYATGFFAKVAGGVGINHLSAEKFSRVAVALPPLPEQHRIVAEVDRLLSIAREAEAEVEANLKRAQGLRQAILSKAFCEGLQ